MPCRAVLCCAVLRVCGSAGGLGTVPAVLSLGLTGGIGSGKSTVSALLEEHGAVVVDADRIVRELQQPGEPVFLAMVDEFGLGIVAADGRSTGRPWPTSCSPTTMP